MFYGCSSECELGLYGGLIWFCLHYGYGYLLDCVHVEGLRGLGLFGVLVFIGAMFVFDFCVSSDVW